MNSRQSTERTSVGVLMINGQGVLVTVGGSDYFLPYTRVPWLREARVDSVLNVQPCGRSAIVWPELDVELEIDSLRHPERYPLVMERTA